MSIPRVPQVTMWYTSSWRPLRLKKYFVWLITIIKRVIIYIENFPYSKHPFWCFTFINSLNSDNPVNSSISPILQTGRERLSHACKVTACEWRSQNLNPGCEHQSPSSSPLGCGRITNLLPLLRSKTMKAILIQCFYQPPAWMNENKMQALASRGLCSRQRKKPQALG